ncbi:MAG: sugar phosphate isomerase/epimerase [Chloroflexi bacterium]|nr:sugar phosphate isomerase/epimerase [Chloroflexota bacterium]
MRKLSASQYCDRKRPFQGDVDAMTRAGLQGIGVAKDKLATVGVDRAVKLLRDAGLGVASYSAGGWFLRDGDARREAIDETKRMIDTAAKLNAACLVLVTGPRGQGSWDDANARFIDGLQQVLPAAAAARVRLAVEPLTNVRPTITYLHLLADTLDVVERVNSPWFGITLDIWYHWSQRDYVKQVKRAAGKTFLVQMSDHYADADSMMDRAPLGEGVLPLKAALRPIADAGYDGWWDIEVFSPRFTDTDQRTLLPRCKSAFERVWS